MDPRSVRGVEDDGGVPRVLVVRLLVVERERRQHDSHGDLVAVVEVGLGLVAVREVVEELGRRRLDRLLLKGDRRVSEPRRELQRVDPRLVDDTVDVDAPDVPLVGEPPFELPERLSKEPVPSRPEHRGPHLVGRGPDVPREQLLVLEVEVDAVDKLVPVEEAADRHLDALDLPLELEPLHPVPPRLLVRAEDVDHVAPVVLVADVQQALDVLYLAERFDRVRSGVPLDLLDTGVELAEHVVFDRVDAVVFEHLRRVAAVLFEAVGVRRPADDGLPLFASFLGGFARTDAGTDPDVVEDGHVGPVDLGAPVVSLRDEPVADLLVAFGLDVVLHVVALAVNLPRQIGDQRGVGRDEEEGGVVHAGRSPGRDLSVYRVARAGPTGRRLKR